MIHLQTKFLTTNIKGTDREMYLPVNFDIDQLPFLRPAPQPTTVMNHPPFVRMEGRSIPPLAYRDAKYKVSGDLIKKSGFIFENFLSNFFVIIKSTSNLLNKLFF